jgi:AbrB family looped-hinge helix DNA binding protein
MDTSSVSSEGQVTIPKALRQRLGIREGSRVRFRVVGDHVELRLSEAADSAPAMVSGFGLLKSSRSSVPADIDPATLLDP